jgi:hypothetical protein
MPSLAAFRAAGPEGADRMTDSKAKPPKKLEMPFAEALERCAQTKPEELVETLAADVLKGRARATQRIQRARQEIEDGALPRNGRFRL